MDIEQFTQAEYIVKRLNNLNGIKKDLIAADNLYAIKFSFEHIEEWHKIDFGAAVLDIVCQLDKLIDVETSKLQTI